MLNAELGMMNWGREQFQFSEFSRDPKGERFPDPRPQTPDPGPRTALWNIEIWSLFDFWNLEFDSSFEFSVPLPKPSSFEF